MQKLAFFISGNGGNALNLQRACLEGSVAGKPVLAISSSFKAPGVERLRAQGLQVEVVLRSDFSDDLAFSERCYEWVESCGVTCICLCGWLKKLVVPSRWMGRILNVHPGLLPKWGGPGMYGMNLHRAVLAAGEQESGCTIHLVDNEYDHGQTLMEARVPVLEGDTPETLQARVYEQEMRLYPMALDQYLKGNSHE